MYISKCIITAYLCEPIEEGPGQALAPAALAEGVLTREDARLSLLDGERDAELGDMQLRPVVKAGVEALQHWLRRQVQLRTVNRKT